MINSFAGENRWLSNFWSCFVVLDDVTYPSTENAYQAAKTLNKDQRVVFEKCFPGKAKREGRKLSIRPDWEEVKFSIMEDLLRQKFSQPELQQKLIATHPQELIEGNNWGDVIWGVCNGVGENNLGKLLMKIRGDLIDDQFKRYDPSKKSIRLGFTGTREGMNEKQQEAFLKFIESFKDEIEFVSHGDCEGADLQFDIICHEFGLRRRLYPSTSKTRCFSERERPLNCFVMQDPKPPFERNGDIIEPCNLLVACSRLQEEELRSGTWMTVRLARRKGLQTIIFWPDGSMQFDKQG